MDSGDAQARDRSEGREDAGESAAGTTGHRTQRPLTPPRDAPPLADVAPPAPQPNGVPAARPERLPGADAEEAAFCELLDDAYVRTDPLGVIQRSNRAAADLFGRAHVWLRGKPIAGFVGAEQRSALRGFVNAMRQASGPQHWTMRVRPTQGDELPVVATVAPVRDAGGDMVGMRWLLRRQEPVEGTARPGAEPTLVTGPSAAHGGAYFTEFLTRVTAVLGATLDVPLMLRSLAELSVPALGDWCLVDLVRQDGGVERVAVACTAVEPASLAAALAVPPVAGGAEPAALALRTQRTQLVREVTAEWLGLVAADARQLEALRRMAPREWLTMPLVARGQTIGAVTFVMAASRRTFAPLAVSVAEELARRAALSADNARLYQQAVRASEAKSAFLGTMSHELRTPLTAVIGYSELLADGLAGPLSERQQDFVRRIRESSDHLLRLVEQVLGFARLEAREERAVCERVDAGVVAEQAVAQLEPQARRKGFDLRLERPAGELWLETDPTKLRQILVNLLGNAVKFTDEGEVVLHVALEPERMVFEVRDTGIGIPAELLRHVFDPFWQVEQTTTRARGGAGLGLSVVRQLARLLGGDVVAESELGRGSRFRLWLPRRA